MKMRFVLPAVAIMLAAGLSSLHTQAQTVSPTPSKIAVVNIVEVFNKLNLKIDGDREIDRINKDLQEQRRKQQVNLENIQKGLEAWKPESAEYKAAQEDLLQKAMQLESFGRFMEQKLLMEQRIATARIYRAMNVAIEQFSKENGIGLVFVTDDADIAGARNSQELLSRITIRKVIYAHPDYDITRKIIEKMNAEHKLGTPTR